MSTTETLASHAHHPMKSIPCARLGRALVVPFGYAAVSTGKVKAGDMVWCEGATPETKLWVTVDTAPQTGSKPVVGRDATSMFGVVRRLAAAKPAAKKPKSKSKTPVRSPVCPKCGKSHPETETWYDVETPTGVQSWCNECTIRHASYCACGDCMTLVEQTSATSVGGDKWCRACVTAHTAVCPRCNKTHRKTAMAPVVANVNRVPTTVSWCPVCVAAHTVQCACCGSKVRTADTTDVDGASWCPVCIARGANGVRHCPECNGWSTRGRNHPETGVWMCRSCLPDPPPPRRRDQAVHGYHGFGEPRKFYGAPKASNALFLGFELEMGGLEDNDVCTNAANAALKLSEDENRFHLEHDGSIPGYGFELISAPATLDAHKAYDWAKLLKEQVKFGLRSHDLDGKCGLHVHVSRKALTGVECAKLDLFIQKNKRFWEHAARRKEVHYAQYELKSLMRYGKKTDKGRYSALNFTKPGTVEFRLFRGTLRYDTLMATLELVDAVCRWIKTRNSLQIVKNHCEIKNFVTWMRTDKARYAKALEYILRTKAYKDSTAANPEV